MHSAVPIAHVRSRVPSIRFQPPGVHWRMPAQHLRGGDDNGGRCCYLALDGSGDRGNILQALHESAALLVQLPGAGAEREAGFRILDE